MTAEVEVVPPTSTVKEAAQKMKSLDAGALPVCDGTKLVGMITDRDITVRAVAEGRDPSKISVKEVMTHPITYCFDDQDIDEAARLMEVKQIRRLVVLNREKKLVGVIALGDIAARHSGELAGSTLGKVSKPYGKAA
jgi:CBS domain-containing protein